MKRLVWSLLIASTLVLTAVSEASAHAGPYRAYERHVVVRHGHSYPRWLSRNSDFHRWYWRSHYRNDFYLSWDRLFEIYRYERRYHRPYRYYDRRAHNRYRDRHHRH